MRRNIMLLPLLGTLCGAALYANPMALASDPTGYCQLESDGRFAAQIFAWAATPGKPAQGGGCLLRPLASLVRSLQDPNHLYWGKYENTEKDATVVASRVNPNPPAGIDFQIDVDNEASYLGGLFHEDWTMRWMHEVNGTEARIRYAKISPGGHIRQWEGELILRAVADGVTEARMTNLTDAPRTSAEDQASTIREFLDKIDQLSR